MMGKLIVIDGLDGCGKSTQLEVLCNHLKSLNVHHRMVSFPEYDKPTSIFVRKYLKGEFSPTADGVNCYTASSFYAMDRYASYKLGWEKDYKDDTLIVCGRYISSNLIHQMTKLPQSQWDSFAQWLYDYECNKLELPNADLTIFLDMPIEISQRLIEYRYSGNQGKKDIHESDVEYLKSCRKSALYSAEKFGWKVIPCNDGKNLRSIEDISKDIFSIIEKIL
ncbi:MAG: deoxynucleoside kinase [Ruminococcus sp.]|nr:deoxynucleoside kinase [Ruminococcus sp.]MCD7799689.1 deoxynucleoside kinase [Ruminococcus sp.]